MDELRQMPENPGMAPDEVVKRYEVPPQDEGAAIRVGPDYKSGAVLMVVNGVGIRMTPHGARDLALLLRQNANRIDLEKSGKKKK